MQHVGIVEDNLVIREELTKLLEHEEYRVSCIVDFEGVAKQILEMNLNIVLLDINLPQEDGYSICRKIRKHSEVPIIVVTSRNEDMDELMAMNLGADDFVVKPYTSSILIARMERLLARTSKLKTTIDVGGIKLDLQRASIEYEKQSIELTKTEQKILQQLMEKPGVVISKETLIDTLWDNNDFLDENALAVNINRIRKKLEVFGCRERLENRRGIGYVFLEF